MDPKDEVIVPTIDPGQEEKKELPVDDVEEKVELSKAELERLQKKAGDFDGLVEKQRLAKLQKSEVTPVGDDEVKQKLEEISTELNSLKAEKANDNLTEAFKEFSKENPWAVIEERFFNEISKDFSTDGLKTKEELVSKLRAITISKFPNEYSTHKEKEIKSKALAEAALINAGGGSGPSNNEAARTDNKKTEEDLRRERLGALLRKNLTWIKK